jgi:hypothetical protein
MTYTQFKAMRQRQVAYQRAPTPHVPLITSPYSSTSSPHQLSTTSPFTVRSLTPSPVAPPAARAGAWARTVPREVDAYSCCIHSASPRVRLRV